jgi:hypothetical protein
MCFPRFDCCERAAPCGVLQHNRVNTGRDLLTLSSSLDGPSLRIPRSRSYVSFRGRSGSTESCPPSATGPPTGGWSGRPCLIIAPARSARWTAQPRGRQRRNLLPRPRYADQRLSLNAPWGRSIEKKGGRFRFSWDSGWRRWRQYGRHCRCRRCISSRLWRRRWGRWWQQHMGNGGNGRQASLWSPTHRRPAAASARTSLDEGHGNRSMAR